ncbi:MAG: site-2 protease family protein [Planctomycetaceae bacterium]
MQPNLAFARWSLSLGTWLGVRVRLNVWFAILLLLFLHWLGWKLGLICFAIFLVQLIIHEFAHILVARVTGGDGDEILLWPLGGLAFCRPGPTFFSEFWTPGAGPLSNALLCLATLPAVLSAGLLRESLNPTVLPIADLHPQHVARDLLILTFALNWTLVLINLIPAFPLDGGQMLRAVLSRRVGPAIARTASVQVGFGAGILVSLAGVFVESTTMVFLGFFLVNMNLFEMIQLQIEDAYGGDFGRRSDNLYQVDDGDDEFREPRLSFWQRWKQQRAAARQERELEARAAAARRLDELLDKVHQSGMQSLTSEERKFLEQASSKYRTQQEGKG